MTSEAKKQDEPMPPSPHAKGDYVQDRALSTKAGAKWGWRNRRPAERALLDGKIDQDEMAAWEVYSGFYELRGRTGRDSLELVSAGGGSSAPFTQTQVDAIRTIQKIEAKLCPQHCVIVRNLCGEGYSMAIACKMAKVSPKKTNDTVRLALSKLSYAIAGVTMFPVKP